MAKERQRIKTIAVTFCVMLLITLSLLSLICTLSFDQNYREVKQSYYATLCDQVIADMETSVSYGKSIEQYYGIDEVFSRTQALFEGDGVEISILDREGSVLYTSYGEDSPVADLAESDEAQRMVDMIGDAEDQELMTGSGYETLFMPIESGGEKVGYYLLSVPVSVYDDQRAIMVKETLVTLAVAFSLGAIVMLAYFLGIRHRRILDESTWKILFFGVPSAILIVAILGTGMTNFLLFQNRYEAAVEEDAMSVVEYVGMTTQELYDKGVTYEEMTAAGLDNYLADKVRQMPVLEALTITDVVADSNNVLAQSKSGVASTTVATDDGTLQIEAFISDEYVQGRMQELFLMFLATFIFCIVIIFEMTRLPAMLSKRRDHDFGASNSETYDYISSGIRITAFVKTLANYMYLPYSALLIKQWDQAVGGLSVGVTAALPLTVDSAAQMIAMALLPMWIQRPDKRGKRFFTVCLVAMLAINSICFLTHSAAVIIVMRFLGGFAYAGFTHVINMIIAGGSDSEARRQVNLASSNSGLIGGCMCGAGIGAIVAALAGYSFSYLISAVLFAVLGVFVLVMMPWELLAHNAAEKTDQVSGQGEKARLRESLQALFTPQVLQYCILIMIPVGFGILYPVTLIPSVVSERGSDLLLSYCYIANGVAGFYLGPKVVRLLSGRISVYTGLSGVLILGAAGIVVMGLPPFFVMVLLSSALLGIFDGYGTPLSIDGFLMLPGIQGRVSEVTALALYETFSNVVGTVAPVLIELLVQISLTLAIWSLGGLYAGFAVLFAFINGFAALGRRRRGS